MPIQKTQPDGVKALVDQGYLLVDVRSVPEFEGGHPPGAANVPFMDALPGRGMTPNPDFAAVMAKLYPKTTKLVLSCLSGGRSMKAAELLASQGWVDLVNVEGGFGAWGKAGLPVEEGAGPDVRRAQAEVSLERARERLEPDDDEGALVALVEAWRLQRSPAIADLIDRLAARVTRPPVGGKTVDDIETDWRRRTIKRDPAEVGADPRRAVARALAGRVRAAEEARAVAGSPHRDGAGRRARRVPLRHAHGDSVLRAPREGRLADR